MFDQAHKEWLEELRNDPKRLKAFLRSVMGPQRKEISGEEYFHLMTVFALVVPDRSSNNQSTWTDEYQVCGKNYHVTYGIREVPIIEEILNDIQQE